MTREEEIKQAATKIAKEWYCGPEDEFHYEVKKLEEMGQWVDEHPKNPWISVEDKLPEEIETENYKNTINEKYEISKDVFVVDKCGNIGVGCYDYTRKFWLLPYYFKSDAEIVQWMPIPQIKKGE